MGDAPIPLCNAARVCRYFFFAAVFFAGDFFAAAFFAGAFFAAAFFAGAMDPSF